MPQAPSSGGDLTRDLTSHVAQGDDAAFEALYRANFDWMVAAVRVATGRDEDFALDAVQSAFLRVIRAMPTLDTAPQLHSWLRRACLSCAYDQLRKDIARERRDRRHASAAESLPRHEQIELLEALRQELARLDPHAASLVDARFRFGWSLERTGLPLELSPGATDGRLRRILAHIARSIGGLGRE